MYEGSSTPHTADPENQRLQTIIERADVISIEDSSVVKLYDFLVQYKDIEHDEILWRLAKTTLDKGKSIMC